MMPGVSRNCTSDSESCRSPDSLRNLLSVDSLLDMLHEITYLSISGKLLILNCVRN